jgi:hypothetical protein
LVSIPLPWFVDFYNSRADFSFLAKHKF